MKEINLAFIATGFMGTLYARIASQIPGVHISALLDIDEKRVLPLSKELGVPEYVGDHYQKMIDEHPEIDGVIVATPEDAHTAPALAVLKAGKNLLVEKPLATSTQDAQKIINAAAAKKVITMIAYSLRFDPRYVAVKAAAERGELGEVIHIVARRNTPLPGLKRINGRVEAPFWVGVHDIDMMHWIIGSNVARVMAVVTKKGLENWNIRGSYFALLTFENGVVASLENSWTPGDLTGRAQPYVFKVEGTQGQAQVRSYDQGVTLYQEHGISEPDTVYMPTSYGRYTGVYHDQIEYFVQCLREGKQTDIPVQEGLNGVMSAEAIMKSAEDRKEVVISN